MQVSGRVDQSAGMLDDEAKEKGYTLLCVSEPQEDCRIATIEEVGPGAPDILTIVSRLCCAQQTPGTLLHYAKLSEGHRAQARDAWLCRTRSWSRFCAHQDSCHALAKQHSSYCSSYCSKQMTGEAGVRRAQHSSTGRLRAHCWPYCVLHQSGPLAVPKATTQRMSSSAEYLPGASLVPAYVPLGSERARVPISKAPTIQRLRQKGHASTTGTQSPVRHELC